MAKILIKHIKTSQLKYIVLISVLSLCVSFALETRAEATAATGNWYRGLYLTGVDNSGRKLGSNVSDSHWTLEKVVNEAGHNTCQGSSSEMYKTSSNINRQATTVIEKGDDPAYDTDYYNRYNGINMNTAIGYTTEPGNPNIIETNWVWAMTSTKARWIGPNKLARHQWTNECHDPATGGDMDNSNTFYFKLTNGLNIDPVDDTGKAIDFDTVEMNLGVNADNLIKINVNGNDLADYQNPGFGTRYDTAKIKSGKKAGAFRSGYNNVIVEIKSSYSNIGFIIDEISLSADIINTPPPPVANSCRPITFVAKAPSIYPGYYISYTYGGGYTKPRQVISRNFSVGSVYFGSLWSDTIMFDSSYNNYQSGNIAGLTSKLTTGDKYTVYYSDTSSHEVATPRSETDYSRPVYSKDKKGKNISPPYYPYSMVRSVDKYYPTDSGSTGVTVGECYDYMLTPSVISLNTGGEKKLQGDTTISVSATAQNSSWTKKYSSTYYNTYSRNGAYPINSRSKPSTLQLTMIKFNKGTLLNDGTMSRSDAINNSDPCSYYNISGRTSCNSLLVNSGVVIGAGASQYISSNFDIPDVDVGTKYCFAFSINDPLNSDTTSKWSHSRFTPSSNCIIVAKKPKVQVWGGDLIVGRKFYNSSTSTSSSLVQTNNVYKRSQSRSFGSWAEYGIFASGSINRMSSGSALMKASIYNGNPINDCNINKLSFTNTVSSSGIMTCNQNGGFAYSKYIEDIASGFGSTTSALSGNENLSVRADGVYSASDVIINNGASSIPAGRSIVIKATGTVTINSDITYANTSYRKLSEIPQVVIMADKIIIDNNVGRIDAWLVSSATGYINTCDDANIYNPSLSQDKCNKQLVVNGPIASNRLYLNRTFGSNTGLDTGNPAEILNLRADAYLWSYYQASKSNNIYTTYTTENPVRF